MKQLWAAISALAIVNLLGVGGLGVYARSQGWLTRERLLAASAALRGEANESLQAATQPAVDEEKPKTADQLIQRNSEQEEMLRVELARREREVQDNWRLLEAQQLAFLRDRESYEEEKKRWAAEQEQRAAEAGDSGQKKELEIISGLKPVEAKGQLRLKSDAQVAKLLASMDVRKARKIVETCKTEEERLWIGRILGKLYEQSATQAEALGAGS